MLGLPAPVLATTALVLTLTLHTAHAFAPTLVTSRSTPLNARQSFNTFLPKPLTPAFSLGSHGAQTHKTRGVQSALGVSMQTVTSHPLGIVITGAAGGVGFAYADEFLARGHMVVICDISPKISEAANALRQKHPGALIFETITDVSDKNSVEALANFAKENLGVVHKWINNAGINGGRRSFMEVPVEQVEAVVKVNLLGALLCTQYAMKLMAQQKGVTGHIFNTVGSGVKGGGTPGYVCYGATKRGQPQMTASLADELTKGVQGYDKKEYPGKVVVHTLSPGMVFTQLLLDDSTPELRKFPFGVLAAQPEEVAQDLVPKILAAKEQGSSVEFLTTDKILLQFFKRFVLQEKSKYVDDDGNVIQKPGAQYDENGVRALF